MTDAKHDYLRELVAESAAWQRRLINEASGALSTARSFEKLQASARALEATWRAALTPVLEMQKSLEKSMAPTRVIWQQAERMRQLLDQLPGRLRRALVKIGKAGWYLDPHIPIPATWELERAIDEGSTQDLEEALVEYFESEMGNIEARIVSAYPERASIVRKALDAYRRGDYELSVPVFLAQADGICLAASRIKLFSRKGGRPRTARLVKKTAKGPTGRALLSLLEAPLPITASSDDADFAPDALNRHAVLHGVSLDYATKPNSLKALSLLNYVAYIFAPPQKDAVSVQRPG